MCLPYIQGQTDRSTVWENDKPKQGTVAVAGVQTEWEPRKRSEQRKQRGGGV